MNQTQLTSTRMNSSVLLFLLHADILIYLGPLMISEITMLGTGSRFYQTIDLVDKVLIQDFLVKAPTEVLALWRA
jgi:hypothetical protein